MFGCIMHDIYYVRCPIMRDIYYVGCPLVKRNISLRIKYSRWMLLALIRIIATTNPKSIGKWLKYRKKHLCIKRNLYYAGNPLNNLTRFVWMPFAKKRRLSYRDWHVGKKSFFRYIRGNFPFVGAPWKNSFLYVLLVK